MRLLLVSAKQHLTDYGEFVEALDSIGVEGLVVHNLEYCFLSKSPPLHIFPVPRIVKLVKRFNPDFVLTDTFYFIPQMLKLAEQRVLLHLRGDPQSESLDKVTNPSLLIRMYEHFLAPLQMKSIKKTDLILPNSKWLQKRVNQYIPNHPTQVLYVGIDPKKWVPNQNAEFELKHPAAVGLFKFNVYQKVKGLLKFIRIIKKMPDINFYFAGEGPYMNLVKQNCPSNMFLLGWLSNSRVKQLLENGDIFIHPSGLDAFPRGLKEASLMEKPIITSNVGGIPEIIKDNKTGYLCDIDNDVQWIEKIRFLMDNKDVAKEFGKNARNYVAENFNWKKIAESFLENIRVLEQ